MITTFIEDYCHKEQIVRHFMTALFAIFFLEILSFISYSGIYSSIGTLPDNLVPAENRCQNKIIYYTRFGSRMNSNQLFLWQDAYFLLTYVPAEKLLNEYWKFWSTYLAPGDVIVIARIVS